MKYWITVLSKDHVLAGMIGGFTQAHGDKAAQLELLEKGDLVIFYSSGTLFRHGEILQAFTGVARVTDAKTYRVKGSPNAQAVRRNVAALTSEEAPAAALAPALDFITDKANWATALRRSQFEIGEADAQRIAAAMKADLAL
jgi:EVE domain